MGDMPDTYHDAQAVADFFKVSIFTIRREIKEGKLQAKKIRGQYRIRNDDLIQYEKECRHITTKIDTESRVRKALNKVLGTPHA